jgi:hypothetical protein
VVGLFGAGVRGRPPCRGGEFGGLGAADGVPVGRFGVEVGQQPPLQIGARVVPVEGALREGAGEVAGNVARFPAPASGSFAEPGCRAVAESVAPAAQGSASGAAGGGGAGEGAARFISS